MIRWVMLCQKHLWLKIRFSPNYINIILPSHWNEILLAPLLLNNKHMAISLPRIRLEWYGKIITNCNKKTPSKFVFVWDFFCKLVFFPASYTMLQYLSLAEVEYMHLGMLYRLESIFTKTLNPALSCYRITFWCSIFHNGNKPQKLLLVRALGI